MSGKMERITISLEQLDLKKLDAISKKTNLSRGQIIRYLLSGDSHKIEYILTYLKDHQLTIYTN